MWNKQLTEVHRNFEVGCWMHKVESVVNIDIHPSIECYQHLGDNQGLETVRDLKTVTPPVVEMMLRSEEAPPTVSPISCQTDNCLTINCWLNE